MDTQIIDEILNGNIDAFEKLVDKYQKLIFNFAFQITSNLNDAQDISQEVFIKIFKNLHKCKGKPSIKTWVYTITYNTSIDFIRKRNPKILSFDKPVDKEGDFIMEMPSDEPTPEQILIFKENVKNIQNSIDKLNTSFKTMIFLRDIKGLSYNEIAEITNLNVGTVKSRLNRARVCLKNILNS